MENLILVDLNKSLVLLSRGFDAFLDWKCVGSVDNEAVFWLHSHHAKRLLAHGIAT